MGFIASYPVPPVNPVWSLKLMIRQSRSAEGSFIDKVDRVYRMGLPLLVLYILLILSDA